jgi:murein DD-endopeptidase MepM/ murein hydrolase activator NlpD
MADIISKREQKYSSPVKWVSVPTKSNRLPNTWRPYRASYTNGVHEGWDFYADFWTPVQAIDYWVVVRVVKDFGFSDLDRIKETWDLTPLDKLWNLDILRGNQVWVKTMKWDVVFYAHLNEIYDNIKEGTVVFKWQPLGTIWTTGVPDQNYTDYHVHLEVRENPYTSNKAPYTFEDYMAWSWYFKGEKESYILDHQLDIFE